MGNPNTIKPGALLRTLREQQNLTVEDISDQTLISLGKLKLLEEDRYSDVGIDLFVSGYIKKYAYIVGADADQLTADFKSLNNVSTDDTLSTDMVMDGAALINGVADDPKITDKSHTPMDAPSEDIIYTGDKTHFLSKVIPILCVLVVLLAIWWAISFFMRDNVPQGIAVSDEAAMETLSEATDGVKASALLVDDSIVDDSMSSDSAVEPITADSLNAEAIALPLSGNADVPSAVDGDAAVSDEPNIDSVSDGAPLTSGQEAESPSVALVSDTTPALDVAQSELSFSFSDDCWVSVKDANGESLFAQLQSSSDNLQLSGVAPFDIQLGNARVATLRVNGEPFAIPVRSGRKTLRFTVTP